MNLRLKRTPGLYMVGFIASGKSTVGRHLATELGWSFFDLNEEIERAEASTVDSLLKTRGEAGFRTVESRILSQHVSWIERGRPAVLALGDGAFTGAANRDLVLGNGIVVWLDCPLDVVRRRISQPPATEQLDTLYHARRETYALADLRIPIESDDPSVTVKSILSNPTLR